MLEWMQSLFDNFADSLKTVLPLSPFSSFLEQFNELPYMGYINWFLPIGAAIKVLEAWLAAILLFYLYSIVLRWIKAIQ